MNPAASPEPLLTREEEAESPPLPPRLEALLGGYSFVSIVRSYTTPAHVYRVAREGSPTFYLKTGRGLRAERDRLRWMLGRLNVPAVEFYGERGGRGFMLLKEVEGRPASDEHWRGDPRGLVQRAARAVRAFHSAPADGCPFDARAGRLLKSAARAVRRGLVRREEFSSGYRHLTPEAALETALALRPQAGRLALTHGDCCLPNLIVAGGSVGFVDVGGAGVGDPWRDLALAARSIRRNLGDEWVGEFFEAYGEPFDEAKAEFFSLLDELVVTG